MHNAMQTSLDSSIVTIPQPEITIVSRNTTDNKGLARLLYEEIKCLFLRSRDPPASIIESLITKIFNYKLYSNEAVEIICHLKRVLTDFCSKFNKKIAGLVLEFKERQSREEQVLTPSRSDIKEFITQDIVEQILKRYLKGTNKISSRAVKELDYLTIGCRVPSRSSKNIASGLSLTNSNNKIQT
ncbi:hypothetical protein F8M41_015190 [Gigaspora margarita]|uniref:Uncharacterized protein n=1 Tax=Gigaspora margarita TaxID=4874 RepID=A0A8H4A0D3_GIGMA|nr:hypothetical protein F8M41_015190 [Gigaspora margarita]